MAQLAVTYGWQTMFLVLAGVAGLTLPDISAALSFAAKAAAITCGRRGADLPRRAELG